MKSVQYKQERIVTHQVAERLNVLQAEGWEYVETIERVAPPTYLNGAPSGPSLSVILLRKAE